MGIKIISSPFEVLRVRSNGKIRKEIFLIRFYRINETIRVFKSIILYLKILIFRK